MMAVLGGQRVGTAMMSMAQVFEGGKLTSKSMDAMMDIGLAGPGGITRERDKRTGKMHNVMHPEAIFDLALMSQNPLQYLEKAQQRMEAKGIHGTDDQIKALMKASQRSTTAGIFADILKDMPAILKEQQNIKNTRPDFGDHLAAVDPAAKVVQFNAALTNFATVMGTSGMSDAMAVLDRVTAGLNRLTDFARDHPRMAEVMFDAAAGLGAIAAALSTVGTAILLWGPVFKMLGIGGAAAGGGGASAAGSVVAGAGAAGAVAVGGAAALIGGSLAVGSAYQTPDTEAAQQRLARERRRDPMQTPKDGIGFDGLPAVPATPAAPQTFRGDVYLDQHKVGTVIGNAIARQGAGPSTGTTGFDVRAGVVGGLQALP